MSSTPPPHICYGSVHPKLRQYLPADLRLAMADTELSDAANALIHPAPELTSATFRTPRDFFQSLIARTASLDTQNY
jgi:hypothetical protein